VEEHKELVYAVEVTLTEELADVETELGAKQPAGRKALLKCRDAIIAKIAVATKKAVETDKLIIEMQQSVEKSNGPLMAEV
jgi:hypothetical protein